MIRPDPPPPEPLIGSAMSPDQFPGAGFVSGEPIDGEAINAYAELVGWRCRFVEVSPGAWHIGYPETPADFETMRAQSAETARLRETLLEYDRELGDDARRLRASLLDLDRPLSTEDRARRDRWRAQHGLPPIS